jgi:hypothetical protein
MKLPSIPVSVVFSGSGIKRPGETTLKVQDNLTFTFTKMFSKRASPGQVKEASLRNAIDSLSGLHRQVMNDVYRHLVLANFTTFDGERGREVEPFLNERYGDCRTLLTFEKKSQSYNAAGTIVYNIIKNQEKNEYSVLASILIGLLQAEILETPQLDISFESYTNFVLPEEIHRAEALYEGAQCQITVNAYERNAEARQKCIERYGTTCVICKFNFSRRYRKVAEGYIHVHHLTPLSEINEQYQVDPIIDLRPVCPNCHAVIHRRKPPYSIEEVKSFLQ